MDKVIRDFAILKMFLINAYSHMRNIDANDVLLQRRMEFVNTEPDTDNERFLTSPASGSQPINIKAEEDPVLMTFPLMRSESEVSCMFVVKHISQITIIIYYLRHSHLSSMCNIFLVE
jgi:hypothetical protein